MKFVFETRFGQVYCLDGYSENYLNSILYYVYSSFIGIGLPTISVVVIYFSISRKLVEVSKELSKRAIDAQIQKQNAKKEAETTRNDSNDQNKIKISFNFIDSNLQINPVKAIESLKKINPKKVLKYVIKIDEKKKRNETRFARQFIIINLLVILSSITVLIISVRNIVNMGIIFRQFYALTQLVRILNILSIGLIPLVSLLFNKSFSKWISAKFKDKNTRKK